MANNVIDNMLSDGILHAFVDAQYEICCEWVQQYPPSIRRPILLVATTPSAPGKAGDLHAHIFDDGLGDASKTLFAVGRSFGRRYLIVSAVILTLQAMEVRVVKKGQDQDNGSEGEGEGKSNGNEDDTIRILQQILQEDDLLEGIAVCALASDGRCIVRTATIQREGEAVTFVPGTGSGMSTAGSGNVLTAFYDGYEAGLAEGREGQKLN